MRPSIDRRTLLAALSTVAALQFATRARAEEVVLNVICAGDEEQTDFIKNYFGPIFEKQNPGVRVRPVLSGDGDAGSQLIIDKIKAQQAAGTPTWDIDVAVVHQKAAGELVKAGLLLKYRDQISTGKMVSREDATNALGADVSGYVMPMFHSQTAIAYNPDLVKSPPKTFGELAEWAKQNPKVFGYNGIKGGMSGVGFVHGWVYSLVPDAMRLRNGPFDNADKAAIDAAVSKLKDFNKNVTATPGNAGTLDMLNRGEIGMGPVWVDMFYSWMHDGKLPPNMKLEILSPGMPGQPEYYVIPAKAAHPDLARKYIELATSPKVQAEGIVKMLNWYPGIDPQYLQSELDPDIWKRLFTDVTPDDLAKNGKSFPITPYFNYINEAYERLVLN